LFGLAEFKFDGAVLDGKNGEVTAQLGAGSWMVLGAFLSDDDHAGFNGLTAKKFDAAAFAGPRGGLSGFAAGFDVGHMNKAKIKSQKVTCKN